MKNIIPIKKQYPCWIVFVQHFDKKTWTVYNINTDQAIHNCPTKQDGLKFLFQLFIPGKWKDKAPLNKYCPAYNKGGERYHNPEWRKVMMPINLRIGVKNNDKTGNA